jgi:hypothetical protein
VDGGSLVNAILSIVLVIIGVAILFVAVLSIIKRDIKAAVIMFLTAALAFMQFL